MPANTDPIFARLPDPQAGGAIIGSTANTATDGTGSAIYSIYQADTAANAPGSFIKKVIFKPTSTVAATVARVWLCNVTGSFTAGTSNTAATTWMISEITLPAWTLSQTAASPGYELALDLPIPGGWRLLVSFGTSTGAGTTGYNPVVVAGEY